MSKLLATVLALVGMAVVTTADHHNTCEYDGVIYEDGEDIATDSDNCYGMYCESGDVVHWDAACFFSTPACAGEQIDVPGQCCPDCINTTTPMRTTPPIGCEVNGTLYTIGDDIPQKDPCKFCECTAEYGVLCRMSSCAPVQCVNPIKKKNQCCPTCPKGRNCWYGKRMIRVGTTYKPQPNVKCSCPDPYDPLAWCRKMPNPLSYKGNRPRRQRGKHCYYGSRKINVGKVYRPKPNVRCSCPEPYEPLACCRKLPIQQSYLRKKLRQQGDYMNPILRRYIKMYLRNRY